MTRFTKITRFFLSGLIGLALVSCGGGGGSGDASTSPAAAWIFTPSSFAGPGSVSMSENTAKSTGQVVAIDVIVTEVTSDPVYGAAFDIVFDPSVIAWAGNGVSSCGAGSPGCRTGDFLEATSLNGLLYNVARQEGTTNVVVVGITQTGSDPGVTGSGTLVTLMFRRVAGGTSDLTFSNNALRSAPLLSQITGMTWIGGTVTLP